MAVFRSRGERLFAEHVNAACRGAKRELLVLGIGRGDVDGVDRVRARGSIRVGVVSVELELVVFAERRALLRRRPTRWRRARSLRWRARKPGDRDLRDVSGSHDGVANSWGCSSLMPRRQLHEVRQAREVFAAAHARRAADFVSLGKLVAGNAAPPTGAALRSASALTSIARKAR